MVVGACVGVLGVVFWLLNFPIVVEGAAAVATVVVVSYLAPLHRHIDAVRFPMASVPLLRSCTGKQR